MPLKIAIIGAGPAGCMLARLLHHKNPDIQVTVFESESALNFRSQGGSLDLHVKTGQLAVRQAGLWDEFLKHCRYDGEAMKIADKNFVCYINMGAGKPGTAASTGRPEIDRPVLREMLFKSLPEGVVRWNKKLSSVDRSGENLTMTFADGTTETGFDLIVGADGAWSKTRNLVSDVKPYYSGIAGHALQIPHAEQKSPKLYDTVNRGSLFTYSDGKGMFAQYTGDGSINIGTWSVHPSDWQSTAGYDMHDGKALKEVYKEEYKDWHPTLQAFLQEASDEVTPRDLYMLPIGHSWEHMEGVTLVGDAAHL
jgi:2-polyprenyl-6-methoxyphenol hydroxylase-like FAD-dependent oxidoreductase